MRHDAIASYLCMCSVWFLIAVAWGAESGISLEPRDDRANLAPFLLSWEGDRLRTQVEVLRAEEFGGGDGPKLRVSLERNSDGGGWERFVAPEKYERFGLTFRDAAGNLVGLTREGAAFGRPISKSVLSRAPRTKGAEYRSKMRATFALTPGTSYTIYSGPVLDLMKTREAGIYQVSVELRVYVHTNAAFRPIVLAPVTHAFEIRKEDIRPRNYGGTVVIVLVVFVGALVWLGGRQVQRE